MSEKELIQCREYFWKQDKNNDGKVSRSEFVTMCDKIGLRLRDREKLKAFNMVDKNNDGFITFSEFVATYFTNDHKYGAPVSQQHPREALSALSPNKLGAVHQYFRDKSKSKVRMGSLSRIEFVHMMPVLGITMSNDELNKAFDIADNNKDGHIAFEEFISHFVPGSNWSRHKVVTINEPSAAGCNTRQQMYNNTPPDPKLGHDIKEICKYFWNADENGDGKLDRLEFVQLLEYLGMSDKLNKQQMFRAFKFADCDRSGSISFKEFINAYLNTSDRQVLGGEQIKQLFFKCDKNKHGVLTKQECIECMKMLGIKFDKQRIDKMIANMDANNDDSISFSEFCEFLDVKK